MRRSSAARIGAALVAVCLPLAACTKDSDSEPVGPAATAIVIVDAFKPPADLEKLTFKDIFDACAVLGRSEAVGKGAQITVKKPSGDEIPPDGVSHGEMVRQVVTTELETQGFAKGADLAGLALPVETAFVETWRRGADAPPIVVIGADISDYDSGSIGTYLQDAAEALAAAHVTNVVLNLSFEYIPCDLVQDASRLVSHVLYRGSRYLAVLAAADEAGVLTTETKNDLTTLTALGQVQDVGAREEQLAASLTGIDADMTAFLADPTVVQGVQKQLGRQDAEDFLKLDLPDDMRLVAVAAAGNGIGDEDNPLPLPFPSEPAIWQGVVSVSAGQDGKEPASGATADYSNFGEILLAGDLPWGSDGRTYHGTSFAAPRLSVLEALYLRTGAPRRCTGAAAAGAGTGTAAPGYAPPLNYDEWDNLTIQDAQPVACQTFLAHAYQADQ